MLVKKTSYFEVDDKIAGAIIKLNQLGYTTSYCCSSHPENKDSDPPYIMFTKLVSPWIKTIPNNWYVDERFKECVIKRQFSNEEKEIFTGEQLVDLAMKELNNWVDKLPMIKTPWEIIDMEVI